MAKRDTKKVAKRSIQSQEWALDIPPHNTVKKHKAKERQSARKEIEEFKKVKAFYKRSKDL